VDEQPVSSVKMSRSWSVDCALTCFVVVVVVVVVVVEECYCYSTVAIDAGAESQKAHVHIGYPAPVAMLARFAATSACWSGVK
jgi:hypothetical protein